jgi:hypothetical protein
MNDRKWERKVRGLLAMAEGTDNAEEAAAFYAKAQRLMLSYGIDEAMLDRGREEKVEPTTTTLHFTGTYARAWISAAFSVVRAAGCRAVYVQGRGSNAYRLEVVGMPDDVAFVEAIVASITLQSASAFKAYKRDHIFWSTLEPAAKVRQQKSFLIGYGQGVGEKVKAARSATSQEKVTEYGSGAELVLVSREKRVAQAFHQAHPRLRAGRGVKVGGGAWASGVRAGNSANVGGRGLGNSRSIAS